MLRPGCAVLFCRTRFIAASPGQLRTAPALTCVRARVCRYKQILARYEAKNTYWTGRVDKQTACTRSFYRDNRWMGYYRRRSLVLTP